MRRTRLPTSLKKQRFIALWITFIAFIFLLLETVAYSALSTTLKISGEAMFRPTGDIRIVNFKMLSVTNGASENYKSEYSKQNIRVGVILPNLNSTITYEVTVTNFVNLKMELVQIENLIFSNNNIEYVITDTGIGDIISGLTTKTFKIIFKYKSSVSVLPADKTLGATIGFTWEEYNPITDVEIKNFTYKGYCENYVIPESGLYQLEVWGGDGGSVPTSTATGKGGYSKGLLGLTAGETLNVCVGGQGENVITGNYINAGGFNGGGASHNSSSTGGTSIRTGGGGASDIRVKGTTLNNRIIVAGGGGGNSSHATNCRGGYGGGEIGGDGGSSTSNLGYGGTQTVGGVSQTVGVVPAGFGVGGSNTPSTVGGGGGGWFGGGNGNGAGGGSGYVLTSTSYKPGGYFTGYANYYLSDTLNVKNGDSGYITNPSGNGTGFARVSYIPIKMELIGDSEISIFLGNIYTELGAKVTVGGVNKSNQIVVTGTVNTSNLGVYTRTYTYTEPISGKVYSIQRTINVIANITEKSFAYTGNVQTWSVPITGTYKFQLWGAEGGQGKTTAASTGIPGGLGGYSEGMVTLTQGTILYIHVGGRGKDLNEDDSKANAGQILEGGYNGGGAITKGTYGRGSGGGATDIRVLSNTLYNRIIVAGGGGGSTRLTSGDYCKGGAGGGSSGEDKVYTSDSSNYHGRGGTQTAGGTGYAPGSFGVGAAGTQGASAASAGGGGWYGGAGGAVWVGGGGGSGYVLTASSHKPSGYFSGYASYYMSNPVTAQPTQPGFKANPAGNGNGYVIVTYYP